MHYFLLLSLLLAAPAWAKVDDRPDIQCHLKFTLKNRWVPVVAGKGEGNIICDDGTTTPTNLRIYGSWIAIFHKETIAGSGHFSKVKDPSKLFGRYTVYSGDAGQTNGKFFSPTVWKKNISFTFDATEGQLQLGLSSGSFTIKPIKK